MTTNKAQEEKIDNIFFKAWDRTCFASSMVPMSKTQAHYWFKMELKTAFIEALASAERDAVERELVGLHDLVMSLDNRCGTATTMQYEVRDVVRKRLKAIQGGKDEG